MSLFDCAYALASASELLKTHVILEITRQQRTGFLSCSIQRAGNSCVYVMFHGKVSPDGLPLLGCQVDPTLNTSTDSFVMLALSVVSVAAGFDAKGGAVPFATLMEFSPGVFG